MTAWTLFVGIISLLGAVWLGWRERHHPLRSIASVLAIASLAAWGLPLRLPQSGMTHDTAVLLTSGYNRDSLNALQGIPVFTRVEDVPPGVTLHVLGYGLDKTALAALPPVRLAFHPSALPDGARAVAWDNRTGQGQPFTLSAHIHLTQAGKVLLSGLGAILDSATLPPGADTDIVLRTLPKGGGRIVYTFSLLEGSDTLENDPVPTVVSNPVQWSILLLSSTPDFENKFLRDWLASNGHRVSMRTAISRDKYDEGYTGVSLTKGAAFLDSADLVITDPGALQALPADVRARVWARVKRDGMGIIVRTDSSAAIAGLSAGTVKDTIPGPVSLVIGGKPLSIQQILPSAYISSRAGIQPLVMDTRKNTWAASVLSGEGKVILTTFQTAYRWMLSGDTADYAAYWSLLLERAAAPRKEDTAWTVTPDLPRLREPMTLSILSDAEPVTDAGPIAGPASTANTDPLLPFLHERVTWPLKTGWQIPTGYVYAQGDWSVVDAARRETETRAYKASSGAPDVQTPGEKIPIPGYYFFFAFLCCAGFLWAAKNTRASGWSVEK